MTVPAVLIRVSTGEIIKHAPLPVADPVNETVPGLDPDLKWLVKHEPFAAPLYDSRVYILERTEAVTDEPHPDYPLYSRYLITYNTVRRPVEQVQQAIINKEREELQRHIDYIDKLAILGLTVLFRQLDGLQLTAVEREIRDRVVRNGVKIFQNHQRRRQLEAEAEQVQPLDIDDGWTAPDADEPV